MTNANKYLKDGVDITKFASELSYYYEEDKDINKFPFRNIVKFLNEEIKPTLTEDERVILRNIKNDNYGKYIGRGDSSKVNTPALWTLYLRGNDESKAYSIGTMFNHLFQFIQERRRIFY